MEWNNKVDSFVRRCGIYSISIYCTHWCFWGIFNIPVSHFTNNELLLFILAATFAVAMAEICMLFKRVVAFSPLMDMLLFGNILKDKKRQQSEMPNKDTM